MIKRHGKAYWLDLRIGGRRIRRSLKTDEHGLALDRAREVKEQLHRAAERRDITIHEFSLKYLEWAWDSKPASANEESQRMKKVIEFFDAAGVLYLSDVTPFHLERLRAWLKEWKDMPVKKDAPPKPPRSKATLNRYLQLLRGMFYRAIDWELYTKPNPVKKVKFYREESPIRPLSRAELEKVLAAARQIAADPQSPVQKLFPDLLVFGQNTGLRKSEILQLRWKDIQEGAVSISGKGDRRRTVPLNRLARDIIRKQPRRSEFVFEIPNRKQPDLFRRTVLQIRKRSGVEFHFHLLRHFFTTSLVERGADIVTIGALLGHSRATTSLIYSHSDAEKKKRAVDLLGR